MVEDSGSPFQVVAFSYGSTPSSAHTSPSFLMRLHENAVRDPHGSTLMATTTILRPRQTWAFNSTKRKLPLCSEQTFCSYHLEHGSLNPGSKSRKIILSNSPQGRFLGCRNHSLIISLCTCWILLGIEMSVSRDYRDICSTSCNKG